MVGEYPLSVHCIQKELEAVFAKLRPVSTLTPRCSWTDTCRGLASIR